MSMLKHLFWNPVGIYNGLWNLVWSFNDSHERDVNTFVKFQKIKYQGPSHYHVQYTWCAEIGFSRGVDQEFKEHSHLAFDP